MMNRFIHETANKALCTLTVSQNEYQTLSRLLNDPGLNENDITLARRIMYGVRHGLVNLV